jgi:hypothetical protein
MPEKLTCFETCGSVLLLTISENLVIHVGTNVDHDTLSLERKKCSHYHVICQLSHTMQVKALHPSTVISM